MQEFRFQEKFKKPTSFGAGLHTYRFVVQSPSFLTWPPRPGRGVRRRPGESAGMCRSRPPRSWDLFDLYFFARPRI